MTDYYNAGAGIGAGLFGNRQKEKREDKKVKEARAYSNIQTNNQQAFQRELAEYDTVSRMLDQDARMVHDNAQLDKTLGNRLELQKLSNAGDFWQDLFRNNAASAEATNKSVTEIEKDLIAAGIPLYAPDRMEQLRKYNQALAQAKLQTAVAGAKGADLSNRRTELSNRESEVKLPATEAEAQANKLRYQFGITGNVPGIINEEGFAPYNVNAYNEDTNQLETGFGKAQPLKKLPITPPVSITPRAQAIPSDLQYFDFLLRNNLPTTGRY